YIWEPDEWGTTFAEHLKARAREGVRVRVIYDGLGSSNLPWSFVQDLRDARIETLEFRPLAFPSKKTRLATLRRRDHRKILVVDGEVSFCGGINLGNDYASVSQGGVGWRDTHLEIRGP